MVHLYEAQRNTHVLQQCNTEPVVLSWEWANTLQIVQSKVTWVGPYLENDNGPPFRGSDVVSLVGLLQCWLCHCSSHCYCFGWPEWLVFAMKIRLLTMHVPVFVNNGVIPVRSIWVVCSNPMCVVHDFVMVITVLVYGVVFSAIDL